MLKRTQKRIIKTASVTILVVAALVVGGVFYLSTIINRYTPTFETMASARVGAPVTIGSTTLDWQGFGVQLNFHDVSIQSTTTHKIAKPAVKSKRVGIEFTPLSFITFSNIRPSAIDIIRPQFNVDITRAHGIHIRGLPIVQNNNTAFDDWAKKLHAIGPISIHDGSLTVQVPSRGIKAWQVQHINGRVKSVRQTIGLRVSTHIPKLATQKIKFHLKLTPWWTDLSQWRWHGHVKIKGLALGAINTLFPKAPFVAHHGRADIRFYVSGVEARLTRLKGTTRSPVSSNDTRLNTTVDWRRGKGGEVSLNVHQLFLALPELFRTPLGLKTLKGRVFFSHHNGQWSVDARQLNVITPDFDATGHVSLMLFDDGASPFVNIKAQAQNIDASVAPRYLPVGIMPQQVVDWVDHAVVAGHVDTARVIFRGRVEDFPFYDHQGLFRVAFKLKNGRIKYDPDWPLLSDLTADVKFENEGLTVHTLAGDIAGINIKGSTVSIADLAQGNVVINVDAQGDSSRLEEFLRTSPIRKTLDSYLQQVTAKGPIELNVDIALPLTHIEDFKVHGRNQLKGVDLKLKRLPAAFKNLTGQVAFTQDGLTSSKNLKGQFLGHSLTATVHRSKGTNAGSIVNVNGRTYIKALKKMLQFKGDKAVTGRFKWHAKIQLPSHDSDSRVRVHLSSNLKGVSSTLPAPFSKQAGVSRPSFVSLTTTGHYYNVAAMYGDVARGQLQWVNDHNTSHIQAGVVHFGQGKAMLPDTGVLINGKIKAINLDQWRAWAENRDDNNSLSLPIDVDVQIGALQALDQTFKKISIVGGSQAQGYRFVMDGPDISGTMYIPKKMDAHHGYKFNFNRLYLKSKFKRGKAVLKTLSPLDLSSIQFTGKHVRLGGHKLGTVHFKLNKIKNGVAIPRFSLKLPSLNMTLFGTWVINDKGKQQTRVNMSVRGHDINDMLQYVGFPTNFYAKKVRLDAEFYWLGPPSAHIVDTLGGAFSIKLDDGRIPKVSTGAARLLALLSLNALPRRLLFQFGDVLDKGFSYDAMGGAFTLKNGNAFTDNFKIKSTIADVHVSGRVGLAQQDYDEHIRVNAHFESTLPIAGALAGGPVAGVAVFLLTEILKHPLNKATAIDYYITGPWDNPVVSSHAEKKSTTSKNRTEKKAKMKRSQKTVPES